MAKSDERKNAARKAVEQSQQQYVQGLLRWETVLDHLQKMKMEDNYSDRILDVYRKNREE